MRFVADEQVQESIAVVVEGHSGLRRTEGQQTRLKGDVGEVAVAVVSQERERVVSVLCRTSLPAGR